MKNKIEYEVKIEKSLKIILAAIALGLIMNVFASPIYMEIFGMKEALAERLSGGLSLSIDHSGYISIIN